MDNIDDVVNNIIENNHTHFIKDNFVLTNYEIDILKRYNIDYQKCGNMEELINLIDMNVDEESVEELEDILISISDRNYYMNTKK